MTAAEPGDRPAGSRHSVHGKRDIERRPLFDPIARAKLPIRLVDGVHDADYIFEFGLVSC